MEVYDLTGESLLDRLARLSGCRYLSELRCEPSARPALQRALAGLSPRDFPLDQWQAAARYLLDRPLKEETAEQIYRALLDSPS